MRLSTRLLRNAVTTYLRLGATFALGLFTTWYTLGAVGVVGFGLMALAVSSSSPSRALERSLRFGLVRELAAAIASGEPQSIRRSASSAFRFCLQVAVILAAITTLLVVLALCGVFNTPPDQPELELALAALILGEGIHAGFRLLGATHLQSLFAAQKVGLDNLLMVLARTTHAMSAVLVFGWLLRQESLAVQLVGFAASRVSLQLVDVAVGVWLARRRIPGLRLDASAYDESEYRSIRSTVWHSSQVSLLLNINPQLLAVLINLFFGLTYNTIWQIVVQFCGYARMLADGLLRGIAPLTTHLQESGRVKAIVDLMARSIRYQLAVVLPAATFLGLYARPLLELWVGRRLAADPHLSAAGISVSEALELASAMAVVLLVVQILRAAFFGVESVLYGMGEVRSYAWFSKWATLLCIGLATVAMVWCRQPVAAPIAMLISHALYSPCAVLLAARRAGGLPIRATLRRALPRPLFVSLMFLGLLAAPRNFLDPLTLVSLVGLLIGSGMAYALLTLLVIPDADERRRLGQLLQSVIATARARRRPKRRILRSPD